jgi:hypothetical protein
VNREGVVGLAGGGPGGSVGRSDWPSGIKGGSRTRAALIDIYYNWPGTYPCG